jgi:hypothetical protein
MCGLNAQLYNVTATGIQKYHRALKDEYTYMIRMLGITEQWANDQIVNLPPTYTPQSTVIKNRRIKPS